MILNHFIKKHRDGLFSILRIGGIIVLIKIPIPKSDFLKMAVLALAATYYVYILTRNLFSQINYKKKRIDAIRFNTSNDEYYKLTNLIAGTLLILISVTAFIYDFMGYWSLIGIIIGLLMILNGYYFIPTGNFQFQENNLFIETPDSKSTMYPVETIKEIAFKNQSIVITKLNEEKESFFNLNISQNQLSAISNYLNFQAPQIESSFNYSDV